MRVLLHDCKFTDIFFEIKFKIKESARYGRADSFLWGVYREFVVAIVPIVSTTSYSSSKLYSSYDEVFGVTTLIAFKVSVDLAEVGLAVACRHDILCHAHLFLLIVNAHQPMGRLVCEAMTSKPRC